MLHKNRFRVGDGDGDGDGDYKGDDDGDGHGDGHDEEGDDANLNSSRSPPATQLAATRDDIHQHWWRHSPSCMGIALVQIQLEN